MIIRLQHCITNPAEGIDTISFGVNPYFINYLEWCKYKHPKNYITLRKNGGKKRYYSVDVQCEVLNMQENLCHQVISIIMHLFRENILRVPLSEPSLSDSQVCQYVLFNLPHIAKLTALDFYFDFKPCDIKKYKLPARYKFTNYSLDHERSKSLWIVYDRREKLKAQNQISHSLIDNMLYPMRVEIRLRRGNGDYLNFKNIDGAYYDVMYGGYFNYVAKSWRKYNQQLASVCYTPYHPVFNNILQMSTMPSISMLPLAKDDSFFK